MKTGFDYVIAGGGTAGCVLAARLSEDPSIRVLLLEAGPRDRNPWIAVPAGVSRLFANRSLNWAYQSEAEPGLEGRSLYWPRGKVLGGTSAINGHVYMRGNPADYDAWRDAGNPGWGWQDVLPWFRRSEAFYRGEGPFHGGCGELPVTGVDEPHPASADFVAAAEALGFVRNDDFNGARQEGVGYLQYMIGAGRRGSTARVFLRPALKRPNLTVVVDALVERVLLDGTRARGLRYRTRDGVHEAAAARETLVCGGTVNSPQLLMLSGIGPADHLESVGIPVALDQPAVGGQLHDHIYVHCLADVDERSSLNRTIGSWRILPEVARYVLQRRGLLTSAAAQVGLFARSTPDLPHPDLQIQMRPFSMIIQGGSYTCEPRPAITASCTLLRPYSRGHVRLKSPRPDEPPLMRAGYLTDERDLAPLVEGMRIVRDVLQTAPFSRRFVGERLPGAAVQTHEQMVSHLRRHAQSMYHPVGTCRMGPGPDAVVDAQLRVHGVEALRVIDASVMPTIPSGNTNAPVIMIAERGADLILHGPPAEVVGTAHQHLTRHDRAPLEGVAS